MAGALLRKTAKAVVFPVGAMSGRRPSDFVALLYHRVGIETSEISLPVAAFERQLGWLRDQSVARTLEGALAGDGGVVVTFDDGTVDFYTSVVPLLVRYRVPALLYVATAGIDRDGGLTWRMLREAVATGLVTVGSHTHDHADLSSATEHEATDQMRRSKELVEDKLGIPCRHFAYPWAVGSVGADRAARRLFETAALDGWRTNRRGRTDPYRLGRVPVLRNDGYTFFRAKAAGRLNAERLLYRVLRRGPWRPERNGQGSSS